MENQKNEGRKGRKGKFLIPSNFVFKNRPDEEREGEGKRKQSTENHKDKVT